MMLRLFSLVTGFALTGATALAAVSPAEQFGYLARAATVLQQTGAVADNSETQQPAKVDGFYVVLDNYFPKIPSDLPADEKPAVWLHKQDPKDIQWDKSPQPIFFFIPQSWAKTAGAEESEWTPGRAVTVPIRFSYTPPAEHGEPSEPIATDGALLLKVQKSYADADSLEKAYPPIREHGVDESVIKLDDDGTFGFDYSEEGQGEISLTSKPMELASPGESWPASAQKSALDMYYFFHKNFGCFVATAIYRTPSAPQLVGLRAFRDKILQTSESGRQLLNFYYRNGPRWAWKVCQQPMRAALVRPVVVTASFCVDHLDLDNPTTQKVLHRLVDVAAWLLKPWMSSTDRGAQPEWGGGVALAPAL